MTGLLMHLPAISIALPLFSAFLFQLLGRHKKAKHILAISSITVLELMLILQLFHVASAGNSIYVFGSETPVVQLPSSYGIPIRISFQVDMFNAFLSVLTSSVMLLVIIFSLNSLKEDVGKFYVILMLMLTGMLGLLFTNDLFNLFVFLEILSLSTGIMVMYKANKFSVEAGFKYLVISSLSGLLFLLGVGFIYAQYGMLNISVLASIISIGLIEKIALGFMVVSLFLKSGIAPMHMWLPDAYGEAPEYSVLGVAMATLTCSYAFIRLLFVFSVGELGTLLILGGLLSAIIGSTMSLIQKNVNRLFGYLALAEIGFIVTAIGCGLISTESNLVFSTVSGGLFHMLNDVIDLGILFFISGIAIRIKNSKELDNLSGFGDNKILAVFFILAMFAVSGIPPMNGFLSKLIIYESTFAVSPLIPIILMISSIIILSSLVKVFYSIFNGKSNKKVPLNMMVVLFAAVIAMLVITLFPDAVINNLIKPVTDALITKSEYRSIVGV